MGRLRSHRNEPSVSLFPFLSILACMIGTLTLLIAALAITGMDAGRNDESIRRAEEYMVLKRKSREHQKKIADIMRSSGEQGALEKKLFDVREQIKAMEDSARIQQVESALSMKTESDINMKIGQKQKAIKALESEIARLEKELKQLGEELARCRQTMSESMIKVLPSMEGKSIKYKPHFVEATKNGIVIYGNEGPHVVVAGNIDKDKVFNELLGRLSGKKSDQLVLLIRNDGLGSRGRVLKLASEKDVTCGQLPLVGGGNLDLTGVKK